MFVLYIKNTSFGIGQKWHTSKTLYIIQSDCVSSHRDCNRNIKRNINRLIFSLFIKLYSLEESCYIGQKCYVSRTLLTSKCLKKKKNDLYVIWYGNKFSLEKIYDIDEKWNAIKSLHNIQATHIITYQSRGAKKYRKLIDTLFDLVANFLWKIFTIMMRNEM